MKIERPTGDSTDAQIHDWLAAEGFNVRSLSGDVVAYTRSMIAADKPEGDIIAALSVSGEKLAVALAPFRVQRIAAELGIDTKPWHEARRRGATTIAGIQSTTDDEMRRTLRNFEEDHRRYAPEEVVLTAEPVDTEAGPAFRVTSDRPALVAEAEPAIGPLLDEARRRADDAEKAIAGEPDDLQVRLHIPWQPKTPIARTLVMQTPLLGSAVAAGWNADQIIEALTTELHVTHARERRLAEQTARPMTFTISPPSFTEDVAERLRGRARPATPSRWKKGDRVQLKSGGPVMRVAFAATPLRLCCAWDGDDGPTASLFDDVTLEAATEEPGPLAVPLGAVPFYFPSGALAFLIEAEGNRFRFFTSAWETHDTKIVKKTIGDYTEAWSKKYTAEADALLAREHEAIVPLRDYLVTEKLGEPNEHAAAIALRLLRRYRDQSKARGEALTPLREYLITESLLRPETEERPEAVALRELKAARDGLRPLGGWLVARALGTPRGLVADAALEWLKVQEGGLKALRDGLIEALKKAGALSPEMRTDTGLVAEAHRVAEQLREAQAKLREAYAKIGEMTRERDELVETCQREKEPEPESLHGARGPEADQARTVLYAARCECQTEGACEHKIALAQARPWPPTATPARAAVVTTVYLPSVAERAVLAAGGSITFIGVAALDRPAKVREIERRVEVHAPRRLGALDRALPATHVVSPAKGAK